MYLDNVSKARVFALLVPNQLTSLGLLAAELRGLFLKLISSGTFELRTNANTAGLAS